MDLTETWIPAEINPTMFPAKLWYLVNSPNIPSVFWNSTGDIVIIELRSFIKAVLFAGSRQCKIFRTKRYMSILRQLHLYGFTSLSGKPRQDLIEGLPRGIYRCFKCPFFMRYHPEGLASMIPLTKEKNKQQRRPVVLQTSGPCVPREHLKQDDSSVRLQPDSASSHCEDPENIKSEDTEAPVAPSCSQTSPPSFSQTSPPSCSQTSPPSFSQTSPPSCSQTSPPSCSQTSPPAFPPLCVRDAVTDAQMFMMSQWYSGSPCHSSLAQQLQCLNQCEPGFCQPEVGFDWTPYTPVSDWTDDMDDSAPTYTQL